MVKKLFVKPKVKKSKPAFNPQQLNFSPKPVLTKAQMMLSEVVGGNGERTWGTGQNLPRLNRALTSGGGLIKNGDDFRETGRMFGVK